ncbi:MAG: polyprenyl synthetase family protein [Nitrospinae bacterium]|nr:polyprenyl synthetase family protein [Nitrospinota bacterium]
MEFREVLIILKDDLNKLEASIKENFQSDVLLIPTISNYLSNGGKRIRPILLLTSSRLCGYNNGNKHITYSCVVEFIHTATLLHDDVLDEAEIRRGNPAANLRWGNGASVLVGDFLLSRSLTMMAEVKDPRIIFYFSDASRRMVEGEVMEMINPFNLNITEEEYIGIIKRKTASLISASCRVGAILGKSLSTEEDRLSNFGTEVGIAFQLVDDVFDYASEETKIGKEIGKDIRKGKVTLPLIHLYNNASQKDRKLIEDIVKTGDIQREDFNKIVDLMKRYHSIDYTMDKARGYIREAKERMSNFKGSLYLNAIFSVADYIVERDM